MLSNMPKSPMVNIATMHKGLPVAHSQCYPTSHSWCLFRNASSEAGLPYADVLAHHRNLLDIEEGSQYHSLVEPISTF